MKTIGIIGFGYVGEAMLDFFESYAHGKYEICAYDTDPEKRSGAYREYLTTKENINRCDVAIVCVPTPKSESYGFCNTAIVEDVISWLETPLILIKSSVPPGTTDDLKLRYQKRIVFSPEYCGESSYYTPYEFHTEIVKTPFFIFGGDKQDTSQLVDLFLPIAGPCKKYIQTSAKAAEMAKYMENTFYATKIAYCYEIAQICETLGVDYNEARELWLLDPRINPMHTLVFKDNDKPFSGKCLPKDLSALIELSKLQGYYPNLLEEVQSSNERIGSIRKSQKSALETQ